MICLMLLSLMPLLAAFWHQNPGSSLELGEYKFSLSAQPIKGKVVAVADVNADGLHDLIVWQEGKLYFHLASAKGAFSISPLSIPIKGKVVAVHYASFHSLQTSITTAEESPNLMVTTAAADDSTFTTLFFSLQSTKLSSFKELPAMQLDSRSLLLLVNYHSAFSLDFLGMDLENRLVVWSFAQGKFAASALETNCKLAAFHQSHFVDVNCNKKPDIVLHCSAMGKESAYLEFWLASQGGEKGKLAYTRNATTFSLPLGTTALKIADFFANGISQLVVGDANGKVQVLENNIHFCSAADKEPLNCAVLSGYNAIEVRGNVAVGFSNVPVLSLKLSSEASIARIQLADVNLDGELELAVVLSNGTFKLLSQSTAKGERKLVSIEHSSLKAAYSLEAIEGISVFLAEQTPYLHLLLVNGKGETLILENESSFDSFFIHLYPLDVPFRRHGEFAPSAIGSVVYFTVHSGSTLRIQSFCFGAASTDSLSCLPSLTFGLGRMNNFLPYLTISRGGASFERAWNSIIPNSKLRAFVGEARGEEWWYLQIYFQKSKYFWTVFVVLLSVMVAFGGLSAGFKWREVAEDKLEKKRNLSRMNFNAL